MASSGLAIFRLNENRDFAWSIPVKIIFLFFLPPGAVSNVANSVVYKLFLSAYDMEKFLGKGWKLGTVAF
jgi:hypothetical protein